MTKVMTQFEREIREQADCLQRLLSAGRGAAERIAAAVEAFGPQLIVTAARGSSDNAARYAKYVFGAHNGYVVSLGAPSLLTLYHAPPRLAQAFVLGISQSGESPDIVALVAEARRQGALTAAITNEPASPLARAAEHLLPLNVGPERAVAASKSYTAQLFAVAMVSAALDRADRQAQSARRWEELAAIPASVAATIASTTAVFERPDADSAVASLADRERMVVLGRGFNFATVHEVALKIKETAYLLAEPCAAADIFHGPMAVIEPGFPVVVVAPSGLARDDLEPLLGVLEQRQADLVMLSDDPALRDRASVRLALPLAPGVPEWLSPIPTAIPGQLFALALARARGHDPDQPRGLSKVTRTF